jgi:hypothetical protein
MMINPRRVVHSLSLVAIALASSSLGVALETKDWKFHQSLPVERAGIVKVALPPATLDAARPQQDDLRLLDPAGHEVPYVIEHAAATTSASSRGPESFRVVLADTTTQLLIGTGTTAPLVGIIVQSPSPSFLKAARVEISNDGQTWTEVAAGAALFRQFGAEQLRLDLANRTAAQLRITIDDAHTTAVPFTGATLLLAVNTQLAPMLPLPTAQITHREEFAGETVLTLDLGAKNVPLASIEFAVGDSLFTRRITVATQEMRDDTVSERTLGSGTIYRLALDGMAPTVRVDVPLAFSVPRRELLVHVANGDSPPLTIDSVIVNQRPIWLVFSGATPGVYTLLSGNADVSAPRYDVSGFAAALKSATPSAIKLGLLEDNPDYQRRIPLADTPAVGGAIDPAPWPFHKTVQCAATGVQQLELDLAVLAGSANNLDDLRLGRDGLQVPYVLERTTQSRAFAVPYTLANDPKRPQWTRWQLTLPRVHAPITRLTLTSSTTLFQREIRLFEVVTDEAHGNYERNFALVEWHKMPSRDQAVTLPISFVPAGNTVFAETNNGDNPPIALTKIDAAYPVVRVLFKANAGSITLYYGNANATAPRYDLALVADQLIAAEKNIAALGAEETTVRASHLGILGQQAGILFWGVLALVVVALLVVVARLLPKPPSKV